MSAQLFRQILVPTDGSQNSVEAGQLAFRLAQLCGAQLTALYVVDTAVLEEIAHFSEQQRAEVRQELFDNGYQYLAYIDGLARQANLTLQQEIREGVPHEEIVAVAILVIETGGQLQVLVHRIGGRDHAGDRDAVGVKVVEIAGVGWRGVRPPEPRSLFVQHIDRQGDAVGIEVRERDRPGEIDLRIFVFHPAEDAESVAVIDRDRGGEVNVLHADFAAEAAVDVAVQPVGVAQLKGGPGIDLRVRVDERAAGSLRPPERGEVGRVDFNVGGNGGGGRAQQKGKRNGAFRHRGA